MKKSDLKALINECIHEVLAEESADKKTKAISEIKRIVAENELSESELEEIFGIGKTEPATDAELDTWLSKNPGIAKALKREPEDKQKKWREFVKKEEAKAIKKGESITNIKWDDSKKDYVKSSGGGFKGFMGTLGEEEKEEEKK